MAKDAKETVQECVSEFISFVTSECVSCGSGDGTRRLRSPSFLSARASDKCQREKRKTINADDLLWAISTLGFESYQARDD